MDVETDIVKQGYLRCRSKTVGVWQRRWFIFRRSTVNSTANDLDVKISPSFEKYSDEKCVRYRYRYRSRKMTLLTSVENVVRLHCNQRKHCFALYFNDNQVKLFACDSDVEADSWVKSLIEGYLIPEPGLATGEPDVLSAGIQKELQEQFPVYLMPNRKLDIFGECLLQVTHENIYLWDSSSSCKIRLLSWPLTSLRRYGSDPTKFTFEAGRHCATGEGLFVFHTLQGEKIYRKVHQATLAIAEAHQRSKADSKLTVTEKIDQPKAENEANTELVVSDVYEKSTSTIGRHRFQLTNMIGST